MTLSPLLLGLLDCGRITTGRGQMLDARACAVVLTTNAITQDMLRRGPLGFGETDNTPDPADLLETRLPREFLARCDAVILFRGLDRCDLRRIMHLRLEELQERLIRKGVRLVCDHTRLVSHLLPALGEARDGARGVVRLLEQKVLQPVSMALLDVDDAAGPIQIEIGEEFYARGSVRTANAPEECCARCSGHPAPRAPETAALKHASNEWGREAEP